MTVKVLNDVKKHKFKQLLSFFYVTIITNVKSLEKNEF